ncbi:MULTISPECIES: pyridoxal-phosphate dependent enzyme [unclassified Neorhizobium]|uniref:pyridoxal-phosphate dependent enzyme n=1 Tax=unclassified Neorhizobium TaxID=2629175 RepID=UPI001FF13ADC|nr:MULTISPECIES: pyridoxal-phosphate dependent enzyme [unclassified Neorhizobium]MCJ9673273.1 pyridoxal-phosphate dependent enzyme [Neorhizobium sp. SHOUNA12B]MCJ9748661.1 pyridoxal-phosphate dependent enzyme [Neorhizobium sp. SHOUNA12A]
MIYDKASDVLFDEIFFELRGFAESMHVLVKIEGLNLAGSIKLKTAIGLVDDLEAGGLLRSGSTIIESSSGNLGIALSIICAERGYGFICVSDPNALPENLRLIEAHGGQVVLIDRRDENGGFLGSRIAYVRNRLAEDPNLVWTNQYGNWAGAEAHRKTTAHAILNVVPDTDCIFVGVGTSGTIMGCQSYLDAANSPVRLIGVDVQGSVTFGGVPGRRHIPGLGTSMRPALFSPTRMEKVVVTEAETILMAREVLARWHFLVGGSTASVLAAVRKNASSIPPGAKVVAVSPDLGEKYLGSIYDDRWVEDRFPGLLAKER